MFARQLGLASVDSVEESAGGQAFLKSKVGRRAAVYDRALRDTLKGLPESNPFQGLLGLKVEEQSFPGSLEAQVLKSILARSTRVIASHGGPDAQYVPFQNNEEDLVIQPANHLIVGRRGVGKSTLISRATELLRASGRLCVVLDMDAYNKSSGQDLINDVLADLCRGIASAITQNRPVVITSKPASEGHLIAGQ